LSKNRSSSIKTTSGYFDYGYTMTKEHWTRLLSPGFDTWYPRKGL